MIDTMKKAAGARFRLTQQDIGDYANMKGKVSRFRTKIYDAEGAGRLCVMEMKAAAGLVRMETGVFSPTELDGPIFSFDFIRAAGGETLFLELYDTTLSHPDFADLMEVAERYADLPDHDPGEHWYDDLRLPVSEYKKGWKITKRAEAMMRDYAESYFRLLSECPACDAAEKKQCNAVFADGLLVNGGPAVNTFREMMGDERTETFLREYMFCCR